MKRVSIYLICFLGGVITGFIIFSRCYKPIEIPVLRFKTITNTIKEPHYIVRIYKEEQKVNWYLHHFKDSVLEASLEAKTDSVRNFKYTILKAPEIVYFEKEKVKEKILEKKWLIFLNSDFQKVNLGIGYKYFSIGSSYDIVKKEFRPSIGVFINF